MTDFDPDAYLTQDDSKPSGSFDPDAYLRDSKESKSPPPTATEHLSGAISTALRHPFTYGAGLAENALSSVTAGAGSLADAVTGSDPGTHNWGYQPRTEAGQEIARGAGEEGAAIGRTYDATAGTGPLATTIKERGQEALGAVGTVAGVAGLRGALGGAFADAAPLTKTSFA